MKKRFFIMALVSGWLGVHGQTITDAKVQKMLSQMTVEEKAGEMTQIDIRNLLNNGYANTDEKLDATKLKEAIQTYHVGSLLNCINAYSGSKWQELINQIQAESQKSRLKIPVLYGTDAVHGVSFLQEATLFPHNIGLAATRNDNLSFQAAQVTAKEAKAVGLTWNFAPVLDVGRDPRWSRFEETFGEDVYLASMMGTQAVKGMEGSDLKSKNAVASCMKHFIGYSAPKNGIDRTPAYLPEIILREYYLPTFQAAVKAGASTVMINSAEINGIPTHSNKWLLTDVLRGELGFEGLVCSDWEDVIRLHTWHKIAKTPKEAVELAVNAGIDMSMVPNDYSFPKYVVELVKEGKISQKRLNEAVGRILKLKIRLGLLDQPYTSKSDLQLIGTEESKLIALQAARESITLLKNNANVLPLAKGTRILLTGPAANSVTALHGSWSYTWQGNVDKQYPSEIQTIRQVLEKELGKENVITNATRNFSDLQNTSDELLKDPSKYDAIVLCLGEDAYAEQPGVVWDMKLDENQRELIKKAKGTGKPVIVCLLEGRPRLFQAEEPMTQAVLLAYRPGSQGAQAIADILTGKESPSGRLSFTYPRYNGDMQTYDHKFKETEQQLSPGVSDYKAFNPQWEFGTGL
ncbi:MAG: glycoside hydrolase family 3 C-terminal domain-containing protein, partial [Opitutaceae bacterium]|nr:glycoside hydrolase family 3 C-terminal domain-containing protein [Cytophagales bacterium]